ncbi:hypothetical protein P0J05_002899 [Vibrio vulnificus]|nr:hypothetical protein [Vibrio vulnificus]
MLSFPCTRETIYPRTLDAAFGITLTTTDSKNNDNTVVIPTHYTRYTMGPRVREDDEIKEGKKKPIEDQRQRTKTLNTAAHHQLSFPCTRETIYPHTPDATFGNTLPTTDSKSNDNTVVIPTHNTRYTMGPRVREDDEIKEGKKKPIEDQRQRTKTLNTAATNCHSRAHGKPFIRARQMPHLEMHSPQQTARTTTMQ